MWAQDLVLLGLQDERFNHRQLDDLPAANRLGRNPVEVRPAGGAGVHGSFNDRIGLCDPGPFRFRMARLGPAAMRAARCGPVALLIARGRLRRVVRSRRRFLQLVHFRLQTLHVRHQLQDQGDKFFATQVVERIRR